MASVIVLLILLAASAPAYATDYTVGDSTGWTSGGDYKTWASGKTFAVGDTLLFKYSLMHTVDEVSQSDYNACSSSNSIQSFSDQSTKITLTKPGTRYFICGTPGHCSGGMQLAVTVSAATSSPPASPTTPSSTPSTPAEGSPAEGSTPSDTPTQTSSQAPPTTKSSSTSGSGSRAIGGGLDSGKGLLVGLSLVVGLALLG
ncbi:mavicyanin-like [Typha angustifolia]|uniref:mavicyanin-like n=1 Tax=Typha angustifolia TaxID=59011 RepID=UPI003C2D394E